MVAGVAVAAALIAGAFAVPTAQAAPLTSAQVQSIISLLQSFGADAATIANVQASLTGGTPSGGSGGSTGGTGAACYAWTRDLSQGSNGADVMALQVFLNTNPATMVASVGAGSPGMETMTFGPATHGAVMKYQTANGISPVAGYVGPITRASIAAKCSGTTPPGTTPPGTTPPPGASGDEGQLTEIDNNTSGVESSLDEGEEDVKVFGAEMEAQDSEMTLERVDVDFTFVDAGNGSDNLEDYITEVSLFLGDDKLATLDVDEADVDDEATGDFTTAADANDVYSFRFVGLSERIDEGDTAELYVAVSAVNNIDTADESDDWAVLIPDGGIRAVDGAGISDTYVDASDLDEENFSIGAADAGDIDLTASASDNEDRILVLNADADTDGVEVMSFTVESQASDNVIQDLTLVFATTTATSTLFSSVIDSVHLMVDGAEVGSESISGSLAANETAVFDNIDVDVADGEEVEFTVEVDFKDDADTREGFAFNVTVDASEINAEDGEGDDVTVAGDVTGGDLELRTSGISVEFVSADETTRVGSIAGDPDIADLTIIFDVTAVGDDDVYIDADLATAGAIPAVGDGFFWATTTQSTTGTSTSGTTAVGTPTLTADGSTTDDDTAGSDLDFFLDSGDTRRITFRVSIPAGGDNVNVGAMVTGIMWGIVDATDSMANLYDFNLDDVKTDTVTGLIIH